MKIRPNVKFSDGTPLDAAAVKFSLDRQKDPTLASRAKGVVDGFSSVTAKDPTTVEIVLAAPNLQFPQLFGFYSINWVVSPTAVQSLGADFGTKPVGAGPFMLQSRTPNQQLVFVRNPNYWNKPLPYLDQITFKINPDNQQSVDTLISGQAQMSQSLYNLYTNQAVAAGNSKTGFPLSGGTTVIFNVTQPPFNNVKARQAVSLAINPQLVADSVYNGADKGPLYMFAATSPFYDKKLKLPVNTSTGPNPAAQKLFDELAAQNGGPLKFSLAANTSSGTQLPAKSIQTQLASYKNVEMSIATTDNAAFQTKLATADFQMTFSGATSIDPEPQFYTSLHTGGANNYGKFSDPAVDQALEEGRNGKSLAVRKEAYTKLQQAFVNTVPGIYILAQTPSYSYNKSLAGFQSWGSGGILLDRIGFASGKA
jgi:peptide/nickel transport system substrate-binding protein